MRMIHSIQEYKEWRNNVSSVAFVPTMGNLHEGHLALVQRAKAEADNVVVSICIRTLRNNITLSHQICKMNCVVCFVRIIFAAWQLW